MSTSLRPLSSLFFSCMLFLVALIGGCGGSGEQSSTALQLPTAALQAMLDAQVAGSTQVSGALLAVDRDGDTWIGVAGKADTATGTTVQPVQRFRVGSLTKQFTAALVLQLVEEGKLTLDDTVHHWLPSLQLPYDQKITLRMLLNHTSGVANFTTQTFWNDLAFPYPYRAWQPVELIELAKAGTPTQPGTVFAYCNTNYVLAGMITEAATHESVAAAMRRRFFIPLGMTGTELAADGTMTGNFIHGYLKLPNSQTVDDVSTWNPSYAWTAGSLVTSVHDMLLWARALFGGRVLSATSLEAMLTPVAPSTEYGLGLGLNKVADGRTFIYHSGLIPGYSAIIAHQRESNLTIFIVTNREDISHESNDIVTPIFENAVKLLP